MLSLARSSQFDVLGNTFALKQGAGNQLTFFPEIIYQLVFKGALFLEQLQVRAEAAGLFAADVFLEMAV